MKETTAKRREKPKDSKADKQKDAGPDPQDVEMPEEDAANATKPPKEVDTLTLEGKPNVTHYTTAHVKPSNYSNRIEKTQSYG